MSTSLSQSFHGSLAFFEYMSTAACNVQASNCENRVTNTHDAQLGKRSKVGLYSETKWFVNWDLCDWANGHQFRNTIKRIYYLSDYIRQKLKFKKKFKITNILEQTWLQNSVYINIVYTSYGDAAYSLLRIVTYAARLDTYEGEVITEITRVFHSTSLQFMTS